MVFLRDGSMDHVNELLTPWMHDLACFTYLVCFFNDDFFRNHAWCFMEMPARFMFLSYKLHECIVYHVLLTSSVRFFRTHAWCFMEMPARFMFLSYKLHECIVYHVLLTSSVSFFRTHAWCFMEMPARFMFLSYKLHECMVYHVFPRQLVSSEPMYGVSWRCQPGSCS